MNSPFWLKMEQIFAGPVGLRLIGLNSEDIFYAAKRGEFYRILEPVKPLVEFIVLCDALAATEDEE